MKCKMCWLESGEAAEVRECFVVDRVFCCGKGVKRRERENVGRQNCHSVHLLCNKFLWDPESDIKLSF